MKHLILLLTLVLLFAPVAATAQEVTERGNVDVIVRVQGKLDIRMINGTPGEVKTLLMAEAEDAQRGLMSFLDGVKQRVPITYRSIWIINAIALNAPMEVVRQLNNRPDVVEIIPDQVINLPPTKEGVERPVKGEAHWNIELVNATEVWKRHGLKGKGVRIGHIDSGCDGTHSDLAGKIYAYKDFIETSATPTDGNSHGTHSLGTIIGGNNSGAYIGVAPEATAAVAKVFSASGSTSTSALLNAMEWIMDPDDNPTTDDAPRVVSNSWGSSSLDKTFWDAVAAWVQADIFPCFAAGNSGPSARTVGTPGGLPHAFAVGATTSSDSIASFSSRGPARWDSGDIIKPEVSAPGKDIKSCVPGGGWGTKSGTSMACPNVAGAIALLYQAEPGLSVADVTRVLEETAVDLGEAGKDNTFGSGRIDLLKAVENVLLGGTLKGTLQDESGRPLAGVRITVDGVMEARTGADGSFSGMLKEGDWKVNLSAFGYMPESFNVKIVRKQVTDISRRLRPAPRVTLQGTVLESAGNKPLAATVSIVDVDVASVQSDATTGKYRMELPAGNYRVRFNCFQYTTREFDVKLGTSGATQNAKLDRLPPVLLVADAKDDVSKWYKDALDACNTGYTLLEGGDSARSDLLLQYPLVVWFTGKDSTTLSSTNQSDLTAYLNAGGHLFVSGQDIGYNIKSTEFYREVLQAKYIADSSKVKTLTGGDAPFNGLSFSIAGGTGAGNQSYPDVIQALAPAKAILRYDDGNGSVTDAGLLASAGNVVYLAFGFEGISTETARNELMKASLSLLLPAGRDTVARLRSLPADVSSEVRSAVQERLLLQVEADLTAGNRESLTALISECNAYPEDCQSLSSSLKEMLISRDADGFATELEQLNTAK